MKQLITFKNISIKRTNYSQELNMDLVSNMNDILFSANKFVDSITKGSIHYYVSDNRQHDNQYLIINCELVPFEKVNKDYVYFGKKNDYLAFNSKYFSEKLKTLLNLFYNKESSEIMFKNMCNDINKELSDIMKQILQKTQHKL